MFLAALFIPATVLFVRSLGRSSPTEELDRSPYDLAVSRDGRFAVTANGTSDTVSLVDLVTGKVSAETRVGKRPFAIAFTPDGRRALVTNWLSDSVTVLAVTPDSLIATATMPVGDEPRGISVSPNGANAYVALAGENSVLEIDLRSLKAKRKFEAGIEPWHVAITANGGKLVVGNARSQDVSVIDLSSGSVKDTVRLRGHNVRHIAIAPDGDWAYVPNIAERGRPATRENIDLGWVIGNRLNRVPLKEEGPREAIAMDPRGKAVADVDGIAVSPDGQTIAVTAAGTHELLLFRQPLPFVSFGGPDDHIDKELLADTKRFRRVALGGRPLGVTFLPSGKEIAVANYLSNAIQIIDVVGARVTKTIPLGGPAEPSLSRKGEAIFNDGNRCFNQWYSCNTCHVEGHTNGSNFDTFNDGSYGTPKKTLSLRGVTRTGPWTWHGWQTDLRKLVHDSMAKTMQGPEPADAELDAVLAYLKTIDFRPLKPRTETAKRGETAFKAKACDSCHQPPDYTKNGVFTVGLESPEDVYKGFNPPSLRGVGSRSPFLHNGSAYSLAELLTKFHRPSQLSNKPDCTAQELADLVAFLKSL